MKTVLKTITFYAFFNAIIAIAHDLLSMINFGPLNWLTHVLSIFVQVFSFVMFPLMFIVLGIVVYYFIRIIFFKDKENSFKYLFFNSFSFLTMVYYFAKFLSEIA